MGKVCTIADAFSSLTVRISIYKVQSPSTSFSLIYTPVFQFPVCRNWSPMPREQRVCARDTQEDRGRSAKWQNWRQRSLYETDVYISHCACIAKRKVLWPRPSVYLDVLYLAAFLHYSTARIRMWLWRMVYWGCPLVMHYWTDLQSAYGFRCYGNIDVRA